MLASRRVDQSNNVVDDNIIEMNDDDSDYSDDDSDCSELLILTKIMKEMKQLKIKMTKKMIMK